MGKAKTQAPQASTHPSALGRIRLVRDRRTGALRYVQARGNQTTVDRHGISVDTYIHALYDLALQKGARRILMIGCGGGALARLLAGAGRRLVAVDVDPAAFVLARRHFGLPRAVVAVVADGLRYLETTRRRFDLIVLDAFVGERIPEQFLGPAFAGAARRCLAEGGALLTNVCLGPRENTADAFAAGLRRAGWRVRLLDRRGPAERNAIVLAGDVARLKLPKVRVWPEVERERLEKEIAAHYFRKLRRQAVSART